ncbi:DUF4124 domain-containing protein [Tahibacter soli]|uniref:DUF4124 domain-containing protein n=1 Tax=Tahibacter soli TaxID=2983605 RepID=A0A9X4BHA9_9GAMM|nr:DUF4124 domain-containing protein [Tahibacter soli]MDC8013905.1 DUF4124 domain-containing protein [Tahibacter soli]
MRCLLLLLALSAAFDCAAAKAYKCTNEKGEIAYLQTPCPAGSEGGLFTFAREPAVAAAAPAPETPKRKAPRAQRRMPTREPEPALTSYECRVANGEVFYQHGPCPAAVVAVGSVKRDRGRGRSATPAQMTAVSARMIPRQDACRRIHAASASGRAGHERDENVSTYEKNLGRDPCR